MVNSPLIRTYPLSDWPPKPPSHKPLPESANTSIRGVMCGVLGTGFFQDPRKRTGIHPPKYPLLKRQYIFQSIIFGIYVVEELGGRGPIVGMIWDVNPQPRKWVKRLYIRKFRMPESERDQEDLCDS